MNRLFFILLLSAILEVCRGCAVWTDRPIEEVLKQNEDSPWLVLVADKTVQRKSSFHGLSYGAIIHPELVITSAIVSGTPLNNLVVYYNCGVDSGVHCDSSSVFAMMNSPNADKNNLTDEDFIILFLFSPLTFSKTVNTVALASGDVDYDPDDCVIHRWQFVSSTHGSKGDDYPGGIVNVEFEVSLNPSNFGMPESEQSKLMKDIDCVLKECWTDKTEYSNSSTINFMGSPIVCKENDTQVLVGFSTYSFEVIREEDLATVSLANGTLVEFSSDLNFINHIVSKISS